MSYSKWANIELPDELDADDVPGVFASVFNAVDPLLCLPAADITERDTRYADAPKGTVVVTKAELALFIKASDTANTWVGPNYELETTTGFTTFAGWKNARMRIRRIGNAVDLRVAVTKASPAITFGAYNSGTPGNLLDNNIITIPSGWWPRSGDPSRPLITGRFGYFTCGVTLSPNGNLTLTDGPPSGTVAVDQGAEIHGQYFLG